MKCRLVKARRGQCRDVHLFFRCEDGKKYKFVDRTFTPYFYIPSNFGLYQSIFGETVQRIEAPCPENVSDMRSKYPKHYEADIPYARRYLIDRSITDYLEYDGSSVKPAEPGHISFRILYLDIEVYVESGIFPDPDKAEHPVIAISFYDTYTEKYYTLAYVEGLKKVAEGTTIIEANGRKYRLPWKIEIYPDEEQLLLSFLAYWDSFYPDVVAGWNIGFDVEYLRNRGKRYNIHYSMDGVIVFDLMEAYKILGPKQRSYALKEVTVSEGLETRTEALHSQEVLSSYTTDPKNVLKYSLRDVWRIVEIDQKRRLVDYYMSIKALAGLEDITRKRDIGKYVLYSNLPIVDTIILRTARELGIVLPSAVEKSRTPYRGAVVLEPAGGLWEGVAVFDMSRYYPSLIISFNISPEMKLEITDPVNRIWKFKEEPVGLIPQAVRKLLAYRERLEEELQKYEPGTPEYQDIENKIMAVKGVTNSFYGVMANEFFRLFDVDIAATITGLAREGIIFVTEKAKELGYRPLYGDTDSVFIQVPFEKAEELSLKLTNELKQYFKIKYGLKKTPVLKLKFEKYYKRIFFKPKTKKRYAGLLVWKKGKEVDPPQLDIVGFEAVRTDVAPITTEVQAEIFRLILGGASEDEIYDYLREVAQSIREKPLTDVALVEGLSKELEHYRVRSPHVRAAIYSNLYLRTRYGRGMKVRYIYVKRVKCPGLAPTDVVAFEPEMEEEIRTCFEIDWNKQLETVVYAPLREILSSVGINIRQFHVKRWW